MEWIRSVTFLFDFFLGSLNLVRLPEINFLRPPSKVNCLMNFGLDFSRTHTHFFVAKKARSFSLDRIW